MEEATLALQAARAEANLIRHINHAQGWHNANFQMHSDEHGVHLAPLNGEFGLTFKDQMREDLEKAIQELGLKHSKMDLEAAHAAPTLKVL